MSRVEAVPTDPELVEQARRAIDALADELHRRAAGEVPDPFFDPFIDQLGDAGDALAAREWPGESRFRARARFRARRRA